MNILMPQLGETVAEGKITKWFKSAGDAVKPGDNLFEIETDKVSMEVPATEAGVLNEIRVAEGEVAPVGAIVGVIGDGAGAAVSPAAKPAPAASVASTRPAAARRRRKLRRLRPKRRRSRSSLIRSSRCARPNAISDRRELSGGISVTPLARRLGERSRDRSFAPARAPDRTAASSRATLKARRVSRLRPAMPHWPKARPPIRSRRSTIRPATKKCRSTACARPSRRGCSRPSRPSRISI